VAAELELGVLGPLLVTRDGTTVPVPAGRQRALLAFLLLNADRTVPADELIQALWGDDPPVSARASLHNYVKRLRNTLGDSRHSLLRTQPGGYLFSVGRGVIDVSQFEVLLSAAQAARSAGSWDQAGAAARAALTLWRGEPLVDVTSDVLARQEAPRLAELRLQAVETQLGADLELGRYAEVIPELRRLVGGHPLREKLHAQLMVALYRCGRRAEALAAYQDARRILIRELGAEPGTELRELHRRILAADPELTGPEHPPSSMSSPAAIPPRTLPGAVQHFAGRQDELAKLTGLLDQAGAPGPGTVVISAIGGTAGVGKTALAVHWAHQVADRFPDGQLYVNLRGFDPSQPIPAGDALAGFLRALGVSDREIPAELDERAALYRSLLAGRPVLIILDNAASEEQVRPLLPATAGSVAVVTSRDTLSGLVAREGAQRLEVDLLPLADAVALLRKLIGEQASADPVATRTLAVQCARLPLALRVAAERAARHGTRLAGLVAEQADERRRLDSLQTGSDPHTAVRAVFSWSYRDLDPAAARAFRLASLHPGPDLDRYAVAALTGTPPGQSSDMLEWLVRAHLVQPTRPGRYAQHDLLRAYASELVATQDGEHERAAALTRLFDHYLSGAAAAMDILAPTERNRRPQMAGSAVLVPPLADQAAAQAWLDTELDALMAAVAHASAYGWPGHAARLATTLFRYLDTSGRYTEAMTIHGRAHDAARRAGDGAAEAEALTNLGVTAARQGNYEQASRHLHQAIPLFRGTADLTGQARALSNLGYVEFQLGRHEQATGHLQQSLALHQAASDLDGQARAWSNLAFIDVQQGRFEQGADRYYQAVVVFREQGNQAGEAHALGNLGEVDLRQGQYEQAASYLQQALALHNAVGNPTGTAWALANLGLIDSRWGKYRQAIGRHRQSLAISHQTGDRSGEAVALNGLGEAFLAAGQPVDARAYHTAALGLARQTGSKYEQARARDGLGHVHRALNDPAESGRHWREALALYTGLGVPEADQVRAQLAAGHQHPKPPP
jgi:DNA-binding SARP family transcriptional activator/Tfp pilus assembly protein PilF